MLSCHLSGSILRLENVFFIDSFSWSKRKIGEELKSSMEVLEKIDETVE